MAYYLAAFYFAALEDRTLYDKSYSGSNKEVQNAQIKVEEYQNRLAQLEVASQKRRISDQKKLEEWQTKLVIAEEKFESIKQLTK